MKKVITLLTALALTVALCGCESTKTDNPTQDNSSSSIVSSTVDSSDTESSNTESSDTESTGVLSETEAITTANELFNKINELDHMNAGDYVTVDENQTVTVDGAEYTLVTDDRFTTVDDVATFRSGIVTSNVERYSSIEKRFVEQDGNLYVRVTPMGCGFPYSGEATVSDITETSFIAERPYDNFGGISKVQIKVILDNGTWKADELTIEQE